ncbi:MAG: phage holin family protein [Alicyclobacillus sp.]|nr:phage holin family protein [Alicyclobacillus sp.]
MLVSSAVSKVLLDLIYAVVVALLSYGFPLLKRLGNAVVSKVPANYRAILETVAHDAVVYVDQFVNVGGGQAKFDAAVQRVIAALQAHGISLSLTEVEGAIQAAYKNAQGAGLLNPSKPSAPQSKNTVQPPVAETNTEAKTATQTA